MLFFLRGVIFLIITALLTRCTFIDITQPTQPDIYEYDPFEYEDPYQEPEDIFNGFDYEEEDTTEYVAKDEAFEEDVQEIFEKMLYSSYATLHTYYEDPEAAGLDPELADFTLGHFLPNENTDELEDMIDELEENYLPGELSFENQCIREQLIWQNGFEDDVRFDYLDQIWSDSQNIAQNVDQYFLDYQIYSEDGIQYLVRMIESLEEYVEEAREYTKYQAEHQLLAMNPDNVLDYINDILKNESNSPVQQNLVKEVKDLGLDAQDEENYIQEITGALDAYYFPAYEEMKDIVEEYKGDAVPVQGLSAFDGGAEYYGQLVRYYSGTTKSLDEIRNIIAQQKQEATTKLAAIYQRNPDILNQIDNIKMPETTIEEQMALLKKNYTRSFPALDPMEIIVEPMEASQSADGNVLAYTIVEPIDYKGPYRVYYNDTTDAIDTVNFFVTLAHESIPGHVYMHQYEKQYFNQPIQNILYCYGYQEGYATYASNVALYFTSLNADVIDAFILNNLINHLYVLEIDIQLNYDGLSRQQMQSTYNLSNETYDQLAQSPGLFFAYYYGDLMFKMLNQQGRDAMGGAFNESQFNNAILQYGQMNFDTLEKMVSRYVGNQS